MNLWSLPNSENDYEKKYTSEKMDVFGNAT